MVSTLTTMQQRKKGFLERALSIEERKFGVDHGETSITRFHYAEALDELNLSDHAIRQMGQATVGLERAFGADHKYTRRAAMLRKHHGAERNGL